MAAPMTKPTSKSGAEAGPTDFKAKLAELRAQLPAGPALDETKERPKEKPAPKLFGEKVVVRFTRKGHGGKTVTVVTGVLPHAQEALCTEMKKALGCGARVEDGAIVLQGDLVDRACAFLEKKSAPKIVRGS
jgi:translation initiation factor 1